MAVATMTLIMKPHDRYALFFWLYGIRQAL
jgi:hypothetical protein